jgi:hypothetical protein
MYLHRIDTTCNISNTVEMFVYGHCSRQFSEPNNYSMVPGRSRQPLRGVTGHTNERAADPEHPKSAVLYSKVIGVFTLTLPVQYFRCLTGRANPETTKRFKSKRFPGGMSGFPPEMIIGPVVMGAIMFCLVMYFIYTAVQRNQANGVAYHAPPPAAVGTDPTHVHVYPTQPASYHPQGGYPPPQPEGYY